MDAAADSKKWTEALNKSGSAGNIDGDEIAEFVNDRYSLYRSAPTNKDWLKAVEEELSTAEVYSYEGAEYIRNLLESMGHDGLTHLETKGMGITSEVKSHRVYVAFEPTQIKSAKPAEKAPSTYPSLRTLDTDVKLSPLKTSERANIGTFDPTDPSILKSVALRNRRRSRRSRRGRVVSGCCIGSAWNGWHGFV